MASALVDELVKDGQQELADQVRLLEQHKLSAVDMVTLEKELVHLGKHDAALHVRVEIDKQRAIEILSGNTAGPPELLELAKRLHSAKCTGLGRRLLKLARKDLKKSEYPKIYLQIFQKSALFTYKDPDLPVEWRLNRALKILEGIEDLADTKDQETLGLAGAIYKRKWEVDGQRLHLERALFYYLRGYAQGAPEGSRADVLEYLHANPGCQLRADKDQGYTGINAAFVLDVLAQQLASKPDSTGAVYLENPFIASQNKPMRAFPPRIANAPEIGRKILLSGATDSGGQELSTVKLGRVRLTRKPRKP